MKNLFTKYGFFSGNMLHLSPSETNAICHKGAILVDVREDYLSGFKKFDVPDIIYLPLSSLKQDFSILPRNKYLIFADSAGLRSKEAVAFLLSEGYEKIANMAGGLVEWERDGLPLLVNSKEQLSGQCMCQLKRKK